MNTYKKLSPKEYEFMSIIWQHPEGIASNVIYELYPCITLGAKSTILHRIGEKGYISRKQLGKQVYYFSNLTKLEYEQIMLNLEVEKKLGISSIQKLIANFCGKNNLTEEEFDKLNILIEEFKNDE